MIKKPRVVIIGAGMAGLTAAHKLYASPNSNQLFDLSIVEGGYRIGGRVKSSEFCGDRIELGATWIHGIEGSPIYKIAQQSNFLHSHRPSELMNGFTQKPITVAEGGHELNPSLVEPVSRIFQNLLNFIQGEAVDEDEFTSQVLRNCNSKFRNGNVSVGSFLRQGLEAYWGVVKDCEEVKGVGNWSKRLLEEAIFAMHENKQRSISSADDLCSLDYNAERDYNQNVFSGEEITIGGGYSSVIECLASVLPVGMIQLGKKVEKIEWRSDGLERAHVDDDRPVKLHFGDGSTMAADHVIVTVSLGVLKHGIGQNRGMFNPPLPSSKVQAISRLGFGVVNKVFLQVQRNDSRKFPFFQMVFHKPDSEMRSPEIPHWIRKTSFLYPIYDDSRVVLSWFTGKEAVELESLSKEEIINGFSATASNLCNRSENSGGKEFKFEKVMRTKWGSDPLFLGSYSYIAVGSSGDDMDTLAEPLPGNSNLDSSIPIPPLQIMFAGEATHRTHYSNTHGAYFSGLREADRLLKHYELDIKLYH
ncbi:hypothetical protein BUALT_Bualt09G0032700 [Buddleja alternifolia]|uniref:Amine oxidase domain-containing protein n=1 Tax=Buddleja alternifolia TaxID=168488 RepID=A0AAV6X7Q2_9LAMI|nr:hypothetical protein BUALT_Bualt09G0032700 [Buddleja alternifolia]